MPSKTVYEKSVELLEKYFKKGNTYGRETMATKIILNIGGQERTIQNVHTLKYYERNL